MKRLTALTAATTVALSLAVAPTPSASAFTYFTASNGVTFPVFKTATGSEGTLVFLNGDGTRRHTSPASPFVERITNEVKKENVDCLFLLPPNNEDSWWRSRGVDAWSDAMREYLNTLQTPAIELAGYSGGAEFIGRHLTLADTGWVPENTSFTMIGGGSIGGYAVNPPAPGKEATELDWVVGSNDTWLRDQPSFSARHHAERSESAYREKGFQNTSLEVVTGDHYNYDFPQILSEGVREMKSSAQLAPNPVAPPAPAAPPVPPAPNAPAVPPAPAAPEQPAPVVPPAEPSQAAPAPSVPSAPKPAEPTATADKKPGTEPEGKPGKKSVESSANEAMGFWGKIRRFFSNLFRALSGSSI